MKKALLLAGASAAYLVTTASHAMSFGTFDPRSMAMGGTGVASGTGANASYYNPALLAIARDENDFDLVLPTFGVRVADPASIRGDLDDFQDADYIQLFEDAILSFNAATTLPELQTAASDTVAAARDLQTELVNFSGDPLVIDANVGFALAIPNETLGIALYVNSRAVGGGELNVTDEDIALTDEYINELESVFVDGNLPDPTSPIYAGTDFDLVIPTDDFTSTADGRGAVITEAGVSLANEFASLGGLALGITPKYVRTDTFDYSLDVDTAEFDLEENRKAYSDFNFDLGAAIQLGGGWKLGLVGKYLIAKEYETFLGNTVELNPQVRAGVAWETDTLTIAVDADLTKNDPLGFDGQTQFLAGGVELDVADTVQVRAGYSRNMADNVIGDPSLFSVGLGFTFGVRIDLAVAGNSDDLAAGLLLGASF
ncbi:MAG: hypothetical protein AMJ69_09665 [Gammaproteobacteria bacterium SG8_47]|nr:MAG: hypothetical protein AMJ69_09665 [Gammaproteobacteria bacterium SG8_47]